jgi:replicative DNA helicase
MTTSHSITLKPHDMDAFLALSDVVGQEHFYLARTAEFWRTFERLSLTGDDRDFDLVMITDALNRMGVLDAIGGLGYVVELVEPLYPMSEIETIAATLHDVYLQRAAL